LRRFDVTRVSAILHHRLPNGRRGR